ncbi:hypothetical protein [Staphylococcus simulans]|nr:hypothetical protein [Staphylococcus simulans]UXV43414.1 hypothetical protein MUA12_05600 [Staphylococcus simulans]
MSKLKAIKIALLIVILAEEIRNARKRPTYEVKMNVDTDELVKKLKSFE